MGWCYVLYLRIRTIGKIFLGWLTIIFCLCILIEFLSVLFILLTMLSLAAAISMAYLDSLQLVLDGANLVLNTEVLHLDFVYTDDILNL